MKSCPICAAPLTSCMERRFCWRCRPLVDKWRQVYPPARATSVAMLAPRHMGERVGLCVTMREVREITSGPAERWDEGRDVPVRGPEPGLLQGVSDAQEGRA